MRSDRKTSRGLAEIPGWLSVQQVADHLQVSRVTVWRWIRAGRFSGIRVGRVRRIALCSLREFVRQGRTKSSIVPARPRLRGTVFTLDHPLWELVGKGRVGGANVSGNKYKYLAKAIRGR